MQWGDLHQQAQRSSSKAFCSPAMIMACPCTPQHASDDAVTADSLRLVPHSASLALSPDHGQHKSRQGGKQCEQACQQASMDTVQACLADDGAIAEGLPRPAVCGARLQPHIAGQETDVLCRGPETLLAYNCSRSQLVGPDAWDVQLASRSGDALAVTAPRSPTSMTRSTWRCDRPPLA